MKTKSAGSLSTHRAYLGLPPKDGPVEPFAMSPAKVFSIQVSGLAKRLKAIGCRDVVIGISGGLDSALALMVARESFRKLRLDIAGIHAYSMPGFGTSSRTGGNASALCRGLGIDLQTIPIVRACKLHLKDIGHDGKTPDIVFENAQARMRTLILMNKANMTGGIVIGTGDLSEIALGWSTYNGDHMSMFAVNSGVPKTVVRKVCAYLASVLAKTTPVASAALADIVDTPVSPELLPGQITEDKIGPYELHDFFLWNFIMNEMGPKRLLKEAITYFGDRFPQKTVKWTLDVFVRRFFSQAFKRNCAPDGIKVFPFELSLHDWWIPSDLGRVKLHG